MAINPLAYTEKVIRSFLRYQLTTYPFADERLNAQMRRLLSLDETRRTPLLKGPYVSLSRAFRAGASVDTLVRDGVLHPHLLELIPFSAVYGHQEQAIRAIAAGRTTLVSTGTGSGKSECFLYPAISRCLRLRDEGAAPGVCAVVVYPMNALAEDQLGRLRELLAGSGITFGMYVGKTPERDADVTGCRLGAESSRADYIAEVERLRAVGDPAIVHPPEERCSRDAMRTPGQQPRILLTNVEQLELLLTRQQDVELFDNARLDFLVFDEAHTFTGAKGAESACLVRRLRSFCGRGKDDTVCVATSATIVDPAQPDAARDFASRFFGVARELIETVSEVYEPDVWADARAVPPPPSGLHAALDAVRRAVDAGDGGTALRESWRDLAGRDLGGGDWEEALYRELSANEVLYQAAQILSQPCALSDLLDELPTRVRRPVSEEEIILWLTLGAAARWNGRPLVRPVVHGFVRGVPGAVVTFDGQTNEPALHLSAEDEGDGGQQRLRMKVSTCTTCGQHYFEHWLEDFSYVGALPGGGTADGEDARHWEPRDAVHKGVRVLFLDRLISEDDDEEGSADPRLTVLYLCRVCGTAHSASGGRCRGCGTQGELVPLSAVRQKEKSVGNLPTCVCCGAVGRTYAGRFREPAKPVRATNVADVHVLAQDMIHHAERERLLVFADNRQDAAFQAGWMRDHARRFRLRALMLQVLAHDALSLGDLVHKLDDILEADDALSNALVPEVWSYAPRDAGGRRHREERCYFLRNQVLLEITMTARQQLGLEPWGKIKIAYLGLNESDPFIQKWARALRLPADELLGGVQALLDHIRRRKELFDSVGRVFSRAWGYGAREIENGFLPELDGVPRGVKLRRDASDEPRWVDQWLSDGHQTIVKQAAGKWGVQADQVDDFAAELWACLTDPGVELLKRVTLMGSHGKALPNCHGTHQVNGDRVLIATNDSGVYRCRTCRRRTVRRTPHMRCLAWYCSGELEHVPEDEDNYDLRLVKEQYTLLRPREHTAMVPTAERERLEQLFKGDSRAVNALVCTQTLELGVDIGALDAVLMRNVPPMPANYWQRVGRAGRRHRMAVNLTYCRQVNHDRAYFDEPLKMLGGRVEPPSFNLSNELMVSKHVHATVITTLYQWARPGSGAPSADRERVGVILQKCFPRFISAYLFEQDGSLRTAPLDVGGLMDAISVARSAVDSAVAQAFGQGWPDADAEAVAPERLASHIDAMARSLQEVVTRLFRRLRWATNQMASLERIRQRYGALDDEQEAFYNRCKRQVQRLKGTARRHRRDAEGMDDIITYSVLAAEGFLPGYGLECGTVLGMAQVPRSVVGLDDFDLPRPAAVALREYVPGNLIYANGQRFVPRRYYRDVAEDRADAIRFEVTPDRQAIHEVRGHATGSSASSEITSIPVCDVLLLHQSRISDEEENRFQMGVAVYGRELGQHSGGQAYRWGSKALLLRKGVRLQLVNVGASSVIQSRQEFGYPVCRVCGQSVSPFSSELQREDFRKKHEEQCGVVPDSVAFHADLAADALTIPACSDRTEAYSLAEALRFAAADLLEMELADLQILVIGHHDRDDVDVHIYDPMPGGSGLLDQICSRFARVVRRARELAERCPGACENSCIDCFQNYRNAFYHGFLSRQLMKERLRDLGETLSPSEAIPPRHPHPGAPPDQQPVNAAERKLRNMLQAAGFPEGRWQEQRLLPRPLNSTTPDVTFDDPDDEEVKVFIYLDGLSRHLHGSPETRERDAQIRSELRNEGHTVIEITVHDLDDEQQMTRHLRKLARALIGRDMAERVGASAREWFGQRDADGLTAASATREAEPRSTADPAPIPFVEVPYYPTLRIACGAFRGEQSDYEAEMVRVPNRHGPLDPARHFVVRAEGDSMDGGNAPIRDGDYVLLERLDASHAGSLSGYGRPWAVEYRDDSGDNAYTLKLIRKDVGGGYRLVSQNPACPDIRVDPERMFPFARFVDTVRLVGAVGGTGERFQPGAAAP